MTAGMAARRGTHFRANTNTHERARVERRPDYGNVISIECRRCGMPILLDPARMENHEVRVFLLCMQCGQRFLVRLTDIQRPAPDPGVASLYTTPQPKPPSRWKRVRHRS